VELDTRSIATPNAMNIAAGYMKIDKATGAQTDTQDRMGSNARSGTSERKQFE